MSAVTMISGFTCQSFYLSFCMRGYIYCVFCGCLYVEFVVAIGDFCELDNEGGE